MREKQEEQKARREKSNIQPANANLALDGAGRETIAIMKPLSVQEPGIVQKLKMRSKVIKERGGKKKKGGEKQQTTAAQLLVPNPNPPSIPPETNQR